MAGIASKQELAKLQPKKRPSGTNAAALSVGVCGAKTQAGSKCKYPKGFGTGHFGTGRCKHHGGSTPTHVKAAATEEYRKLLGSPMEINPIDALIMCIKIRAGEVQWLGDRMAELDKKAWVEDTMVGKQFHLYARERHEAMRDLARYSQMAISLGIAERAVKLAETYAQLLARLIQGILGDLELNEEQRAKAPQIVRHHLIAIDSGTIEGDLVAMPPGAASR